MYNWSISLSLSLSLSLSVCGCVCVGVYLLPVDLAELPLVKFDFSCNKVSAIPVCYRKMKQLQSLQLENNPLQSPPAQVYTERCCLLC